MSNEAQERKERSIERLIMESVPYMAQLPCIETVSECSFKTKEEIVQRVWALYVVVLKANDWDQDSLEEVIEEFGIGPWLTPKETSFVAPVRGAFVSESDPVFLEQKNRFSWQYESVWVLLWALGYVKELEFPEQQQAVEAIDEFFSNNTPEDFLRDGALRLPSEILDQADLIYRYHWATMEARVGNEKAASSLHPVVVYERHYALNWLIGYQGQEWDDITSDT